jgi:hypothetical protein
MLNWRSKKECQRRLKWHIVSTLVTNYSETMEQSWNLNCIITFIFVLTMNTICQSLLYTFTIITHLNISNFTKFQSSHYDELCNYVMGANSGGVVMIMIHHCFKFQVTFFNRPSHPFGEIIWEKKCFWKTSPTFQYQF